MDYIGTAGVTCEYSIGAPMKKNNEKSSPVEIYHVGIKTSISDPPIKIVCELVKWLMTEALDCRVRAARKRYCE